MDEKYLNMVFTEHTALRTLYPVCVSTDWWWCLVLGSGPENRVILFYFILVRGC